MDDMNDDFKSQMKQDDIYEYLSDHDEVIAIHGNEHLVLVNCDVVIRVGGEYFGMTRGVCIHGDHNDETTFP